MQRHRSLLYATVLCLTALAGSASVWMLSTDAPYSYAYVIIVTALAALLALVYWITIQGYYLTAFALAAFLVPFAPLLEVLVTDSITIADGTHFVDRYLMNAAILHFMLTLSATSTTCFILGTLVAALLFKTPIARLRARRSLSLPLYVIACCIGLVALLLTAPQTTILEHSYAVVRETAGIVGGPSGLPFMVYALLIVLFVDAESAGSLKGRWTRRGLIALTSVIILVWVDLIRGNRHAVILLIALVGLVLTSDDMRVPSAGLKWNSRLKGIIGAGALPIVLGLVLFPGVRANLIFGVEAAVTSVIERGLWIYKSGTWMGAFRSMVGLAAEVNGVDTFDYKMGRTYVQYLMLLPPSFLFPETGGWRPPTEEVLAAFWYLAAFTSGGAHPSVPAFANFGIVGVAVKSGLIGGAFVFADKVGRSRRVLDRLLYGALALAVLRWFWYSDLYVIRALMAVMGVGLLLHGLKMAIGGNQVAIGVGPAVRSYTGRRG